MSKDTCIKANTYCPVHKGIVGADCWHDSKDFSVPRTDWKQVDEINTLREQVEKLAKERDEWKDDAINGVNAGYLREQLAALAEQNVKLREALTACVCAMQDYQAGIGITAMFDQGERLGRTVLIATEQDDLTSPVLNKYRAEGMRMAAEICHVHSEGWRNNPGANPMAGHISASNCEHDISTRAAELEKTNDLL